MTSGAIAKHEIHVRPGVLSFPRFRLDLVEEHLWIGNREVQLRRRPLGFLAGRAARQARLARALEERLDDAAIRRLADAVEILRKVLGE
ncbi:MAG: hypothetical protein ACLQVI_09415 [Polyangiaceae bacterium]